MLVKDVMTKHVTTAPSTTHIAEAKKIMRDHNIRRLPVVDNGKLVGMVSENRLEQVSFAKSAAPLLWQIQWLVSRTTLKDIMRKDVVTVRPDMTIEQAVATAQSHKVGTLVVVEGDKVVGISTTNDFFYKIVNPTLGIGEPGSRIVVPGGGDGQSAERIIACINKLGVGIKILWSVASPGAEKNDFMIHLDTENTDGVIRELKSLGYQASVRPR